MGIDLTPVPASLAVLETVLYAADLTAIVEFYRRVLELEPYACAPERHVFYKCGGQMLLIFDPKATQSPVTIGDATLPPHGSVGQGHVCFRASAAEIAAWRQRLEQLGVTVEADFEWPAGGRSIYFRDPAGNVLEFAEPRIWGLS